MSDCNWPEGNCKCWEKEQSKPDPYGREWMHCEEGLNFSKASMSRFIMFCLANNVEIGDFIPLIVTILAVKSQQPFVFIQAYLKRLKKKLVVNCTNRP